MEKKKKVKIHEVDNECECGGKMKPTGICLFSNPPLYPHICSKCRKEDTYNVIYPYLNIDK